MPGRQLIVVLLVCITIIGAGLFVVSWGNDDQDDSAIDFSTTSTSTSSTTTSAPATTTTTGTPTTVPAVCTAEDTAESDTESEATDEDSAEADDTDPDDEADDDTEPIRPTLSDDSSVSTVGLDEVTFGLTATQAEQASGTSMIPCEPVSPCYRVTPQPAPDGISFLVHDSTIERVDIVDGPITTTSGAGIGTTDERLVELFGDRLEREIVDTNTVNLIFVPTDSTDADFRVAFTVVDGVVETFRAGRLPMVLASDPCAS